MGLFEDFEAKRGTGAESKSGDPSIRAANICQQLARLRFAAPFSTSNKPACYALVTFCLNVCVCVFCFVSCLRLDQSFAS